MIRFDNDDVMHLHELVAQMTGGDCGIRDTGLLESAINGVHQTFGGVELYPTVQQKAARLGYALISNHAFVDGNKRIGMLVMLVYLELNGLRVDTSDEEIVRIGLGVASGQIKYEELLAWLCELT